MSAKKTADLHVHLSDATHRKLAVLAESQERKISELAALLLEKAIAGEFHVFSVAATRCVAAGLLDIARDR